MGQPRSVSGIALRFPVSPFLLRHAPRCPGRSPAGPPPCLPSKAARRPPPHQFRSRHYVCVSLLDAPRGPKPLDESAPPNIHADPPAPPIQQWISLPDPPAHNQTPPGTPDSPASRSPHGTWTQFLSARLHSGLGRALRSPSTLIRPFGAPRSPAQAPWCARQLFLPKDPAHRANPCPAFRWPQASD